MPNPNTRRPSRHAPGFTLIEAALATALLSIVIMGGIGATLVQQRIEQGRAVGGNMMRLHHAAIRYKEIHRDALSRLPAQCSLRSWAVGTSRNGPNLLTPAGGTRGACEIDVQVRNANGAFISSHITNGMQPSVADLRVMGLLEAGFDEHLALPLDPAARVARSRPDGSPSGTPTGSSYAILIERICLGVPPNTPAPPAPAPGSPQCGTASFDMASTVFNVQPYLVQDTVLGSGARLGAITLVMDGQGYLAQLGGNGQLFNSLGQVGLPNPVAASNLPGAAGQPGIVAAYHRSILDPNVPLGGLGPLDAYTRRDGGARPTGDWNFDNRSLANVNQLAASAVTTVDLVASGAVIGRDNLYKFVGLTPLPNQPAGPPTFADAVTTHNRGLLVKGNIVTTEQMGVYAHDVWTVGGVTTGGGMRVGTDLYVGDGIVANGEVAANGAAISGNARVANLKMSAQKAVGDACDTDTDSFARNSADNQQLLVCNSRKWSTVALAPKAYRFTHSGAYVAEFYVDFVVNGQSKRHRSGNVTSGAVWEVTTPGDATNITAWAEGNTGLVWALWRTIFTDTYPGSYNCYTIRGTSGSMSWRSTC